VAKLYFRYGTMDSAKSMNLLAVAHNYRKQGKKVLLVKPRLDTRFGAGKISSRSGLEAEADLMIDEETVLDPRDFAGLDCVLVDEAHSLGALGETGRGLCESTGVLDDCHFIVGTFSKTLGAVGGYAVSNHPDFDLLRVTTRPYMFTASLPPSIIASVRQALRVVQARPELRQKLWHNVNTLYDGFANAGFTLGPEKGPVVAVHLPDVDTGLAVWKALLDNGIYVNLAVPPATPNSTVLLRCSICAAHSDEQLAHVVDVLSGIAQELGVLPREPLRAAAAG